MELHQKVARSIARFSGCRTRSESFPTRKCSPTMTSVVGANVSGKNLTCEESGDQADTLRKMLFSLYYWIWNWGRRLHQRAVGMKDHVHGTGSCDWWSPLSEQSKKAERSEPKMSVQKSVCLAVLCCSGRLLVEGTKSSTPPGRCPLPNAMWILLNLSSGSDPVLQSFDQFIGRQN